jgi:hypothetical protein
LDERGADTSKTSLQEPFFQLDIHFGFRMSGRDVFPEHKAAIGLATIGLALCMALFLGTRLADTVPSTDNIPSLLGVS